MILLQQHPMTKSDEAWAKLQPQDDLTQAVYESGWWREQVRSKTEENELAAAIIDELAANYQIEKPVITKAEGKKYAAAVKAFSTWCDGLELNEYLGLPPCYTAQFLREMIAAGAKPSEVKALVEGISYAHRRVWLADPTTDPIVKTIIKRRK